MCTAAAASPLRAANDRIRAAVLGTGHAHAAAKLQALLNLPDLYEVAGVAEPDPAARRRAQEQSLYRQVRWLEPEELLGDASIRVVAVETEVWNLLPWGRKVVMANKHLHLDKPPSHQLTPFRELVEAARRRKCLLQTGYIWRFHQGIRAALEAARQGWLGQVYLMRGVIDTDLKPEQRESLARYRGGMMFELGCHLVDRLVDLWGRPRQVHNWLRHDSDIPDHLADNTLAVFEYDQGVGVISSAARTPSPTPHRSFELTGTAGSIVIQPIEPGHRMQVNLREARGPYRAGPQEIQMPAQVRYLGDFRELARAIHSGQPLEFSYDYELLVQETLLRASGELA